MKQRTKDNTKNINYFEVIDSEEKAYFLGFLLADGSISKETNRISFTICSSDDYILEKLKKSINSENSVRRYEVLDKRTNKINFSSVFQFSDKKIKEDLNNLGISPYKSDYFDYSKIIENKYFNHFLRGLFDGDGYIGYNQNRPAMMFISTKEFLEYLQNKFLSNKSKLLQVAKNKNIYRLYIYGVATVKDFLSFIYKDATIFLQRKYDLWQEMLEKPNTNIDKTRIRSCILINSNKEQKEFKSIKDAADFLGLDPATVINQVKNNQKSRGYTVLFGEYNKQVKYVENKSNFKILI